MQGFTKDLDFADDALIKIKEYSMKKSNLAQIFILIILLAISTSLMAQNYSGGASTSGTPYQIANKADLKYLSENTGEWTKHFIQTANIAFVSSDFESGGDFYNTSLGFSPIGNNTTKFTGSYDGDGYSVSNLYILQSTSSANYLALFGYTDGATLTEITLIDMDISGTYYYYYDMEMEGYGSENIGGLARKVIGTTISGCSISGDIYGYKYVGGIASKLMADVNLKQAIENTIPFHAESGIYIMQISNEQGIFTQKFSWVK
jgi:hypothetical protein